MNQEEIKNLILNGENSRVEFKRDDIRPEDLAKEIVALANYKGGWILLGIEKDGRISGITREKGKTEEWVMDAVIGKKVVPQSLQIEYEEVEFDEGLVGILFLTDCVSKPYAVRHNHRDLIYIRQGSVSQPAKREQILQLTQESGWFHAETLPLPQSRMEDLNNSLFLAYYRNFYEEEIDFEDKGTLTEKLIQRGFCSRRASGSLHLTVAGTILFGKEISRILPQHGFRIIHYRGTEPELDVIEDKYLTVQLANLKSDSGETIIPGLMDSVMLHLKEKLATEEITTDGITRTSRWLYPEGVLRELLVNSIVHRDYTRNGINEIVLFFDRIEIKSIGSLPNTLTVEKIKEGQTYQRNPILVRAAQDYGFMEHRGLGIRRRVLPKLREEQFPEPDFEANEDFFKVTIFKKAKVTAFFATGSQ